MSDEGVNSSKWQPPSKRKMQRIYEERDQLRLKVEHLKGLLAKLPAELDYIANATVGTSIGVKVGDDVRRRCGDWARIIRAELKPAPGIDLGEGTVLAAEFYGSPKETK